MQTYLKIFIIILVLTGVEYSYSQDIHFSQFNASPLNLNPAQTGNFVGDWRLSNIYRQQWDAIGEPFMTASVGFDRQFYIKNDRLSAGLTFIYDQSGSGALTSTAFLLSVAYHKMIGLNTLSFGVQGGYAMKQPRKYIYPDQFDKDGTGQFSGNIPTQASTLSSVGYPDFHAGINYTINWGKIKPQIGASFFHLNTPNESIYTSGTYKLPIRKVINIGGSIFLSDNVSLEPGILFMEQSGASDFVWGTNFRFPISRNANQKITSIFIGAYGRYDFDLNRNNDAAIALIGIGFPKTDLAFSYDVNVSGLTKVTNYRGAFEITLIYKSFSSLIESIAIPCERY